ncbi:MAG: acetyl-CoA carboxylase, carboxyltransferase subunit beta [Planctomycetota bacterium]
MATTAPAETRPPKSTRIPEGLWVACKGCGATLFRKSLEANLLVCPECGHHHRVSGRERVRQLADPDTFEETDGDLTSTDPLGFSDRKTYTDRLAAERLKGGSADALVSGRAFIKGRPVIVAAMDPTFMMGSMGSVVGEKLTRAIERATDEKKPIIVVSCSGGARMQESTLSLMQMAKTSAALARHDDAGGLFVSVLSDPTTGGVTASFAMLGDFILAEPGALIGFAGPRVIESTTKQKLPPGFQRAEFLEQKGFVDFVVPRHDLRKEIARLIDYCCG